MRHIKVFCLVIVLLFLIPLKAYCFEVKCKVPEGAEIAVKILESAAQGEGLAAVDKYFDFETMGERMLGDDYKNLTAEEKEYLQQMLSVFLKVSYRQKWFQHSIDESTIEKIVIEDENGMNLIKVDYELFGETTEYFVVTDKNKKDQKVIDVGLKNEMISVMFRSEFDKFVKNAPEKDSSMIKKVRMFDFIEMILFPEIAASSMQFNEAWDQKKGGEIGARNFLNGNIGDLF